MINAIAVHPPTPAADVPAMLREPAPDSRAASPVAAPSPATAAEDSLDKAIDAVNTALQAWSTGIRFDIDSDTGRIVASIIDTETGDTLRTVPTDAVMRVARMITQLQGQGVDTSA